MLGFTPRLHGLLYPDQPISIFGTPAFAFVNGSAAVVVFFVLSGFVLTVGLFRSPSLGRGFVAALRRWPRLAVTVTASNVIAGALMAYGLYKNKEIVNLVPSLWLSWFMYYPAQDMLTFQGPRLKALQRFSAEQLITTAIYGRCIMNFGEALSRLDTAVLCT